MIVVDANIISYFLIPNETYYQSAVDLYEQDRNWIAPSLWRYELFSVLSLYQRKGIISSQNCLKLYRKALEIMETRDIIDIELYFKFIETSRLSAYDCQYLALASETNLPLITEDKKIISAFSSQAVSMKDYISG